MLKYAKFIAPREPAKVGRKYRQDIAEMYNIIARMEPVTPNETTIENAIVPIELILIRLIFDESYIKATTTTSFILNI